MEKIPYDLILDIQRKVNIVDVISEYLPLEQKGKNYFAICPFHDDHNPSMSISPEKQIYTCFVCGASGNVFNFVMNYENISFVQAVSKVAKSVGISIDYQDIVNISLNIFTTQGMHTTQKAGNPTCRPVNIFHKNFKFSPYFIYQDA